MRTLSLSLFIGAVLVVGDCRMATAQQPAATPSRTRGDDIDLRALPPPTPSAPTTNYPDINALPVPDASTPNAGYPDIESLRKPGSSEKLFPAQPAASPGIGLPGTGGPGAGGVGSGANGVLGPGVPGAGRAAARMPGQRGGGVFGPKRNSGRQHDVLVDAADSDPLQVRVAFRRAKTEAMARDPGMADLLQGAADAGTDLEKREFLKQYYTRLYASVVKIDPSPEMKKHVELLTFIAASRYDPRRREVGGDEDIINGRGGGRRGGGRTR